MHDADGGVDSFVAYVELNERFHAELVQCADSPVLERAIERATSLPFASPSAFVIAQAELDRLARDPAGGAQPAPRAARGDGDARGRARRGGGREHARLARENLDIALHDRRPARASAAGRSSCCRRWRSERVRFERSWRASARPGGARAAGLGPPDRDRAGGRRAFLSAREPHRGDGADRRRARGAALLARRRRAGGRRLPDRGQAPPRQPRRLGLHARPRAGRPAVGLGSPEPVPARLRGARVSARGGRDRHHPDRRHGVRPGPPRRAVPAALRRPSPRRHAVRGRALRAARGPPAAVRVGGGDADGRRRGDRGAGSGRRAVRVRPAPADRRRAGDRGRRTRARS